MLAARGAGIRRVMLPKAGERDLRNLAEEAGGAIEFVFVGRIED